MKSKLTAFVLLAASSGFAETHFSFSIGNYGHGYRPGYYAPPPVYYAPVRPHRFYGRRGFGGQFSYQQNYRDFGGANRQPLPQGPVQGPDRNPYNAPDYPRDGAGNGSRR